MYVSYNQKYSFVYLSICVNLCVFSFTTRVCRYICARNKTHWRCVTAPDFSRSFLHGNRPILSVRHLVTALKEKMEIPSSSSLASKWRMSPPINH